MLVCTYGGLRDIETRINNTICPKVDCEGILIFAYNEAKAWYLAADGVLHSLEVCVRLPNAPGLVPQSLGMQCQNVGGVTRRMLAWLRIAFDVSIF